MHPVYIHNDSASISCHSDIKLSQIFVLNMLLLDSMVCLQDTGVFVAKSVSRTMQETMATDPSVAMDGIKKNLGGMVPQVRGLIISKEFYRHSAGRIFVCAMFLTLQLAQDSHLCTSFGAAVFGQACQVWSLFR